MPKPSRPVSDPARDLKERDEAARDDAALVRYQAKWQRKLRRLQRAAPGRWRVAGLSPEEVVDHLTLRLIEAIREPRPEELGLARPGREWGLLIASRALAALRRSSRVTTVCSDFDEAPPFVPDRSQEQQCLDVEEEQLLQQAAVRAEQSLSRPQRRWLAALQLSASADGFFASSRTPNLSAAARLAGKNRSSALRGYRELQAHFGRELARLK